MPSTLMFGPPADISMGWDGTLWAIDAGGAPHQYDPIQRQWQPHGEGVDAVALVGTTIYHFSGSQYVTVVLGTNEVQGAPLEIGATWPHLPRSFTLGVDGAASVNGGLYLFRGGWYAPAETGGSAPSMSKLTDLAGWPQTPNWKEGAIDAVSSDGSGLIRLFRGMEYIEVELPNKAVSKSPAPIATFTQWQGHLPSDWATNGIDAAFGFGGNDSNYTVYRGTAIVSFAVKDTGVAGTKYIGSTYSGWPLSWNPTLAHAPNGRVNNLWAAMRDGKGVVRHDGSQWTTMNSEATYAAVGQDDSVLTIGAGGNTVWQLNASGGWDQKGTAPSALDQVALGDASNVWVRGANQVYALNLSNGTFAQNPDVGQATHIAANYDGTVWHCNAADANAYRFISGGTAASQAIPVTTAGGTVQRVASTGFGNSFCLVQAPAAGGQSAAPGQIYSYNSNYVFKTAQAYNTIQYGMVEQGLGSLFLTTEAFAPDGTLQSTVVCVDMHTGVEKWQTNISPQNVLNSSPLYDPLTKHIFVTSAPRDLNDATSAGWLIAVNAATGGITWASDRAGNGSLMTGLDAPAGLNGTQLCVGDRSGRIHMFDVAQAFADNHSGAGAKAKWSVQGPTGATHTRVTQPAFFGGDVITATWLLDSRPGYNGLQLQILQALDGAQSQGYPDFWQQGFQMWDATATDFVPVAPAIVDETLIVVHASKTLYALTPSSVLPYDIGNQGGGARFTSGLRYGDGTFWLGDSTGALYGLQAVNGVLTPAFNTPVRVPSSVTEIITTPLVYTDSSGHMTVLYGAFGPGRNQLYLFDPSEPLGDANPAVIELGQTSPKILSEVTANGVVYVAGDASISNSQASGQVFAINIDRATQALRDFIIESQLMQDFDDAPAGQVGATHARYQTHLTVVDDMKAPRPRTAVKIWADAATTISIDGGPPVTIGPNDDQFAAVQTGVDGTLVITSGYLTANSSDSTDVHTTPLRVWAGFMDPYERVVIFPDQEFHTRVTTAVSVTDTTSPVYDDPTVVNLHAAASYAPPSSYAPSGITNPPLFTNTELQQNQPANIANAIQSMAKAVPTGGAASATAARLGGAGGATSASKYTPNGYTLPGQTYFATNTPATRLAAPVTPIGFSLVSNDDDSVPTTYTSLAHADATAAIDALTADQDWQASGLGAPPCAGRLGSWWSSFWNWIKGAAATITHIIISVGKEIYAGLRFIWKGVSYFFKHPLQSLEDVVSAVATFFQKIGKLIKNVVEALSIVFNLGEIYKTHVLVRAELLRRVNGDPADPTHYPGLVNAIKNSVQPSVDSYFDSIAGDVSGFFNSLADKVAGTKTSDLQGSGSTAHTALTVTSKTTGKQSPHSTQCMWANQKLKSNYRSATVTTSSLQDASGDPIADAVTTFFTDFVASITNNGPLEAQWEKVKQGFKNLANVHSAGEFVSQGLAELLRTIALVLDGVIAVGKALVDGLMGMLAKVVDALFNPNTGLLTRTLNIPVLSWLYQKVFGEPLTILNVVTLVAAIPVTLLYKVATGQWPSQAASVGRQAVDANEGIVKIVGLFGGLITIASGIINAISDAEGTDSPPQPVPALATAAGTLGFAIGFPLFTNNKPGPADWAAWGTSGGIAAVSILSLPDGKKFPNLSNFATIYSAGQTAALGAAQLTLFIYSFVKANKFDVKDDFEFGLNLAGALDNLINPLKLLGSVTDGAAPLIVALVDSMVGLVVGGLNILLALQIDSPAPLMRSV